MKITPFVTTQQMQNTSDFDSNMQEVQIHKPDSAQPKVVQGSDSGSEDIPSAQATQKKKWVCIESISTVDQQEERRELEMEEDPDVIMEL